MTGTVNFQGKATTIEELNTHSEETLKNEFGWVRGVDFSDGVNADEFSRLAAKQYDEADKIIQR